LVKQVHNADDEPALAQMSARILAEYQDCYADITQMVLRGWHRIDGFDTGD
jgi:hypothetical protein